MFVGIKSKYNLNTKKIEKKTHTHTSLTINI